MKILEYSMQLAMLSQLLTKEMISKKEFAKMKRILMNDYGVISDITC